MLTIPLPEDVAIKIERAEHLVRELADAVESYTQDAPTKLTAVLSDPLVRLEGGTVAWGVRAHVPDDAPRSVRAIVGDAVNNVRSALDYLARALVVSNGGTPIDGRPGATQFPIANSSKQIAIGGGVHPDALKLVQAAQPAPAGAAGADPRHPLAMIRDLSNEDKHRAPTIVAAGTALSCVFIARSIGTDRPYGVISPLVRWLQDDEWAVMPVLPFPAGVEVVVDSTVRTVLTLAGDGPVMPSVADDIDYLLRWVRDEFIPQFKPFFSPPWDDEVFSGAPVADPMASTTKTAIDPKRILQETQALYDGFPVDETGERHVLVMGMAEFVNTDPRLLGYKLGATPA